ncbi:SLAP domain-containing protein [Peribacillus butanolivorans]|uniref:SLAP domain-containing protein n=1 Tax=Peribacillus butanolivorans TaxID=421767 RepID=UPI0036DDD9D9
MEHALDLAPIWIEQLSEAQRENLQRLVAGLPKINQGEVNFMGLEATLKENNQLAVTVLVRNGSDKQIKIEKLPLIVEDADGDQVCQGGFSLEDFEVKSNTSKPWTFIFPGELVTKKNPDLTSWKVYPPSSK